ncbi:hypothetical protein [Luteibacter sp. SG786]|uniref:hypothetical protein n=1 Tax=Luteibacter sp. SG786 TaxID=2587130 RepID=UPI00141DE460|nr:hypothetical protein [Luteibacter sp. SG786]NII55153.1 rubredoxin [Luteibacter sp. SG786]
MLSDLWHTSAFARWRMKKMASTPASEETRREALEQLLASFRVGELTSLDGVTSPVARAIVAIHGERPFEMHSTWILSPQDWRCPCCGRDKVEISRLGSKGQILAKLVVHHDHMGEAIAREFSAAFSSEGTAHPQTEGQALIDRIGSAFSAYEPVLICEDCNNADPSAKQDLGLPTFFSFSVGQLKQFIQPRPHVPHTLDLTKARAVWLAAQPAYELRMKIIRAVSRAAATNEHWYEPHPRRSIAVPVLGDPRAPSIYSWLQEWVGLDAVVKALGPQPGLHRPDRAKWRKGTFRRASPVPANYLPLLLSRPDVADSWNEVASDWCCAVCGRTKDAQVYIGPKGQVLFRTCVTSRSPAWRRQRICNHCRAVIMSLKEEVTDALGMRPQDSYAHVSPEEVRSIIVARPHSPHQILPVEALALVDLVIARAMRDEAGE